MSLVEWVVAELRGTLGDRCAMNAAILDQHARDESTLPPMAPDAVVYPTSTDEVSAIVATCARHGVLIIPFGAGSSVEGHVLAVEDGVCVDMTQMNRVLAVRTGDLDATVQAGVTREQLEAHVRPHGPFFPVDPGADATIGGMAATGASGTTAVKYGTLQVGVPDRPAGARGGCRGDRGTPASV